MSNLNKIYVNSNVLLNDYKFLLLNDYPSQVLMNNFNENYYNNAILIKLLNNINYVSVNNENKKIPKTLFSNVYGNNFASDTIKNVYKLANVSVDYIFLKHNYLKFSDTFSNLQSNWALTNYY